MIYSRPQSTLSPFRYPGGKSWLVPYIRDWLTSLNPRPRMLLEAFAGGSSVGLASAAEGLVESVTLVELDEQVAGVWQTILGPNGNAFANRVGKLQLSEESVQNIINGVYEDVEQRALATLVKNRTAYGGIIAPGASQLRNGENGKGILSRWYPDTLKHRIQSIYEMRDRIYFNQGDGLDFLKTTAKRRDVANFIDPPYTIAGRRLYTYSDVEPSEVFKTACSLVGDFLITYDDSDQIRNLIEKHHLQARPVTMKNKRHQEQKELLIGRELNWIRLEATVVDNDDTVE